SSEIGRDGVTGVVGQREVARQIDFDPVPLADGDGRKDIQKFVEDLRRGLRGALRESLTHEVATGSGQRAGGSRPSHGADSPESEGGAEDAEVMVVDLVAEAGVADLIETLEAVETGRKPIGHDKTVKGNGETGLAEGFDLAGLAEQLGSGRN